MHFSYYSDGNSNIELSTVNKTAVTINTVGAAVDVFIIGTAYDNDTQQPAYINQYSGTSGDRFAGWKTGAGDNGSKIKIYTLDGSDPLGINGKAYTIINDQSDKYAVADETAGGNGYNGLGLVEVTKNADDKYVTANAQDVLPMWIFEAQSDRTYYIRSSGGKYININGNNDVQLTNTPQKLQIELLSDGHVTIASTVKTDNKTIYLDLFANKDPKVFSAWAQANVNNVNNNEKFYLTEIESGLVIYKYPEYDGTYPDGTPSDTGTVKNLSNDIYTPYSDGYVVQAPVRNTYTSYDYDLDPTRKWIYVFDHWTDGEYNYHAGETITESGITANNPKVLTAVWSFVRTEEVGSVVRYVIELYDPAVGASSLPTLLGLNDGVTEEERSGAFASHYTVRSLTQYYYKTPRGERVDIISKNDPVAYDFVGWQTEDDNIMLQPGDIINIDQTTDGQRVYDTDSDGVITLTAVWSNTYQNGKDRQVYFFMSKVARKDDIFDTRPAISVNSGDFTSAVYTSVMQPSDTAPTWTSAVNGASCYPVVSYDPQNPDSIDMPTANSLVRQLGTVGVTTTGENAATYKLADFPTDEQIFAKLRAQNTTGITLDGVTVPKDDLTTENFTIHWYVCKYQAEWHIDGKLAPNVSYVTITKTFEGSSDAIDRIPESYCIKVKNTRDESNCYTLKLTDKTNELASYGFISGANRKNATYGYVEQKNNTYKWILPANIDATFSITEENYSVGGYGIAASFSVVNAINPENNRPPTRWFGALDGEAATYVAGEVDVESLQTINLTNMYVDTKTFVIQKRDKGSNYTPMPGVNFKVYKFNTSTSAYEPIRIQRVEGSSSDEGRYTVLYSQTGNEDFAVTGKDGNLYFTMDRPTDDGVYDRYKFEEVIPAGYYDTPGVDPPSFELKVYNDRFDVEEMSIQPAEGTMAEVQALDPFAESEALAQTAGVLICNEPIWLVSVNVHKHWDPMCPAEDSVTMRLSGTVDGKEVASRTIVLDAAGSAGAAATSWHYKWQGDEALPLVVGNKLVYYEVEEIKVNDFEKGTPAFDQWIPKYMTPKYYDSDHNQLQNQGNHVKSEDEYKVREIDFIVENAKNSGDAVTINFEKLAMDTGRHLEGAVFDIYRAETDPTLDLQTITFNGETITVYDRGYQYITENFRFYFNTGATYYLEEIYAPEGYEKLCGLIKVVVGENGTISVETESCAAAYVVYNNDPSNPLIADITVTDINSGATPGGNSIIITKHVVGSSTSGTFNFRLLLEGLAAGAQIIEKGLNGVDTTHTAGDDGKITVDFDLVNGAEKVFTQIMMGIHYTVTELLADDSDYISSYVTSKKGAGDTYIEIDRSEITAKSSGAAVNNVASGINGGTDNKVDFTNIKPGKLTISNTVNGNMGSRVKQFEYTLAVSFNSMPLSGSVSYKKIASDNTETTETTSFVNGKIYFTLSSGERVVFENLPYNANVTVLESAEDYDASSLVDGANQFLTRCTAMIGENTTIAFTNTKNAVLPTGVDSIVDKAAVLSSGCLVLMLSAFYLKYKRRKTAGQIYSKRH